MKAQMTIEYMVSFVAFIALVLYIYLLYSGNIPNFISEVEKEHVRSITYQLSELIINDHGQPSNWNQVSVEMIGLSDETQNKTNLLSYTKITNLNSTCDGNYLKVQRLFTLSETFSIRFYNITETGNRQILLNCNPPSSMLKKTEINVTVKRITSFVDNDGRKSLGELVVEVSG